MDPNLFKLHLAGRFKLLSAQCPKTEEEQLRMTNLLYSNIVGNLIYAMILTRPGVSYAISVVSRVMANPSYEHWRVVQWIMRYLKRDLEVWFGV